MLDDTSTGSGTTDAGTGDAGTGGTGTAAAASATGGTGTAATDDAAAQAAAASSGNAPAKTVVPEQYNLKAKDGVTLSDATLETAATTAKSLGLSQEHAQALTDVIADQVAAARTEAREQVLADLKVGGAEWQKQADAWAAASLADQEIGGSQDKLDASVALGQKVLGTFGDPELHKFLVDTGLGNHPMVIRMMAKIGRSISEGTLVKGTTTPAGESTKDPASVLYPKKPSTTTTE